MLDENAATIRAMEEGMGTAEEAAQLQRALHRNLMHLTWDELYKNKSHRFTVREKVFWKSYSLGNSL